MENAKRERKKIERKGEYRERGKRESFATTKTLAGMPRGGGVARRGVALQ